MLFLKDFTKDEILKAVVKWIRDPSNSEMTIYDIADNLTDGSWLFSYEEIVNGKTI